MPEFSLDQILKNSKEEHKEQHEMLNYGCLMLNEINNTIKNENEN